MEGDNLYEKILLLCVKIMVMVMAIFGVLLCGGLIVAGLWLIAKVTFMH